MPAFRRLTPRDRLLGVGLQTRLVAAAAVLVFACGGFLAYRAIAAVGDAYRWTGAAEAADARPELRALARPARPRRHRAHPRARSAPHAACTPT